MNENKDTISSRFYNASSSITDFLIILAVFKFCTPKKHQKRLVGNNFLHLATVCFRLQSALPVLSKVHPLASLSFHDDPYVISMPLIGQRVHVCSLSAFA